MIFHLLKFERRLLLRNALLWIVALAFGAIAFASMASDNVSFGGGVGNIHRNAPQVVIGLLGAFSLFSLLLVTIFVAGAALRDFELNTAELFFSTPIKKRDYLLGRFGGGFLAALFVLVVCAAGLWLGSQMPWLDQSRLGSTPWGAYLWAFGVIVIPNLLFVSALLFALAMLTRSMLYTYLGVIAFFVLYVVADTLARDIDVRWIGALLDPFGSRAVSEITRYWSSADMNSKIPPLTGLLLGNRAIWLGVAALLLLLTYRLFRIDREGVRLWRRKKSVETAVQVSSHVGSVPVVMPAVRLQSNFSAQLRQYLHQTWFDARSVLTGAPFLVMLVLSLLMVFTVLTFGAEIYGTRVYPVTSHMAAALPAGLSLFLTIVIAVYAGELVWRERGMRVAETTDACSVPNWVPLAAKLSALFAVIVVFCVVGIAFCIAYQLAHGYTHLQPMLYAKILVLTVIPFFITAGLFVFLQTMSESKFFGYLLVAIFMVGKIGLPLGGYNHPLYNFGSATRLPLSDMNGYGQFLGPNLIFRAYWTALTCAFLILAAAMWPRGTGRSWGERWRAAKQRLRAPSQRFAVIACLLVFVALGGWIFYNTNVRNNYRSADAEKVRQADYEKTYRKYKDLEQPRITAIKADVDIYPNELRARMRGHYSMQNKHADPIDVLHVTLDHRIKVYQLDFPAHSVVSTDTVNGYTIYKLDKPLAPGANMDFDFDIEFAQNGFNVEGGQTAVVYNGSFFNNGFMPQFGYQASEQLTDRNDRRKYNLPDLPRMASVDDMSARADTYISHDADWVDFETTVSTTDDQIALAPGYLQDEHSEGGRHYFHYKSEAKILPFVSWLSARWAVKKDKWHDVAIEIYYDPQHAYNVDRMIESAKKSFDYYTKHFSAFQFRQLRILEFPNYANFAQSFANTVPYSESIGFIADLRDPDDIDYVFYVTAHEIAHQWWAHQIIGANVQGATMLSESLAQYSALMVMEHEYGASQMRKFLRYELDQYLVQRSTERVKELPLAFNEGQQYLHYNKGSVIFYALKDYIGEDVLNGVLAHFLREKAFQQPPYTTSKEFLDMLKASVDPKWLPLITDLFERITFFDSRVVNATAHKRDDGKYEVKIQVHTGKLYTDGVGKETPATFDEPVDVGIFAEAPDGKEAHEKVLYLDKRVVADGDSSITLVVDELPFEVGIDPFNKLVDRNSGDNRKHVTLE